MVLHQLQLTQGLGLAFEEGGALVQLQVAVRDAWETRGDEGVLHFVSEEAKREVVVDVHLELIQLWGGRVREGGRVRDRVRD